MATADELLSGSTGEVEKVLTIDWESRIIDIPKSITNLGVEYDDDTKHLTFRAPRQYHGADLSTFRIAVGYWNADDEPDVYYPDMSETQYVDDYIIFTWIVGPHAYTKNGDVRFLVYAHQGLPTDDDGVTKRVSTTLHSLPVLPGGDPEQAFVEQHYDAITAAVMEALEQAQNTDLKGEPGYTPVKGVDYFTDEELERFGEDLVRSHNGAFANALKGTASGAVIRVDDVSPVEHNVKTRAQGKNLVPLGYKSAHPNVVRNEDGSVHFTSDGVLDGYYEMRIISIGDKTLYLEPGTYAFKLIGAPAGAHFVIGGGCATYIESPSGTLTVEQAGYIDYIIVRFAKGYTYDCTVYPMFVKGDVIPTEYEPYIDPTSVVVYRCGKNLLPYPYDNMTKTLKGVTITENADGTFVANGTATGECVYFLLDNGTRYYKGKYTFSGISGGSTSTYYVQPVIDGVYQDAIFNPTTLELDGRLTRVGFYIKPGAVLNNMKFKLQIEAGDKATAYEPYVGDEYVPAADCFVDISSVSPTMTLMTDTPGVTIEAKYSKDINKQTFGGGSTVGASARITNIMIPSSAWVTESDNLHSQVVSVHGVTEYSKVDLLPSVAQLAIFHEKDVSFVTENEDGVVTVYAIGDKPTNNYTMQAQITEVSV